MGNRKFSKVLSVLLASVTFLTSTYVPVMAENAISFADSADKSSKTGTGETSKAQSKAAKNTEDQESEVVLQSETESEDAASLSEEGDNSEHKAVADSGTIGSFDNKFKKKKYPLDQAPEKAILIQELPSTLSVTMTDGTENMIPVATWECSDYDAAKTGDYTFTPVIDDAFDYSTAPSIPWIEVCIVKNEVTDIQTVFEEQSYLLSEAPMEDKIESVLPDTVTASVNGEDKDISILSWNTDYDISRAGVYTFTPVLDDAIYSYDESSLPVAVVSLLTPIKQKTMRAPSIEGKVTSIGTFTANIISGATIRQNGDYVWKPVNSISGHAFVFRVSYSTSGQGAIPGNDDGSQSTIKISIPKTILKDRSGERSDYYEMSLPERDELSSMDKQERKDSTLAYYEDDDNLIIYNFKPIDAAQNGYFEIAYYTKNSTYSYMDYGGANAGSAPFYATMEASGHTATTSKYTVYIDTTAEINSTYKGYPVQKQEWQSAWGDKPSDANSYVWQRWEIRSDIADDVTQGYSLTLTDEVSCDQVPVEFYGYQFSGSSQVTKNNSVTNIYARNGYRYDYVYTRIKKTDWRKVTSYTIHNKITAVVHPLDGVDEDTSAVSTRDFEWTLPVFIHPIGHFYTWKFGNENGYNGDYSSYDLDKFQEGKKTSIDNISYHLWSYGYPFPWTLKDGGSSDNWQDYGYKNVTYQITDEALYNLNMDGTYGEERQEFMPDYTNGWETGTFSASKVPLTPRLGPEDYDITAVRINTQFRDVPRDANGHLSMSAGSMTEDMQFNDQKISPTTKDILTIWTKSGTGEYVKAGTLNLGSKILTVEPGSLINPSGTGATIHFKEGVDGIRVTTSNNYYHTGIDMYPYISIKNSARVLKWTGTGKATAVGSTSKDAVLLRNVSNIQTFDSENKLILDLTKTSGDRLRRSERTSEISKQVTGASSNKRKKLCTISWKVNANETYTAGSGSNISTAFITQSSGTFYDLLPEGATLQENSILVAIPRGTQSPSEYQSREKSDYLNQNEYDVDTIDNFRNSGRTMLIIRIKDPGACYTVYYTTIHSWDTIADYGSLNINPVAYETGNDEISGGFPDDPTAKNSDNLTLDEVRTKRSDMQLSVKNRELYKDIDPDTDAYKFIYDEAQHSISAITAAAAGLNKKVKSSTGSIWKDDISVRPDEQYAYRVRFANTFMSAAKDIVLYDSLENYYKTDGAEKGKSAWYGTLQHIDTAQMEKVKSYSTESKSEKNATLQPVVYVSTVGDLDLDLTENKDLSNTSIWIKLTDSTDLSKVKAVAYDLRKDSDGNDFVLKPGGSVSSVLYLNAPHTATNAEANQYAETYNNVYLTDTVIGSDGSLTPYDIHYDYTTVRMLIMADFGLHKVNEKDETEAIKDIQFHLFGTSDYGTDVNEYVSTDKTGDIKFKNIEKGSYILQEYSGTPDWLEDHTEHMVVIDGNAKVTIDGTDYTNQSITIKNQPRVHTDISFFKESLKGGFPVLGTVFKLSGTSDYGNDVLMFSSSTGKNATVSFKDVEKGTYELKEVESAEGYIKSKIPYTVRVDENGNFSIDGVTPTLYGNYIIENEPYHSFVILKRSSYDNGPIAGVEFHLTGTSDYGTQVDTRVITDVGLGSARFEHLEPGTYILEESKGADGFIKSDAKWTVTVKQNDSVEIPDLTTSVSAPNTFVCMNTKIPDDEVVVLKKWVDDDQNTDHSNELPTIHLESTGVEELSGTVDWAANPNSSNGALSYVTSATDKISGFKRNTAISETKLQSLVKDGKAVRLDSDRDNEDAQYKIYGWLDDNNVLNWWSNAQMARLTDENNNLFVQLRSCKKIDLSWIDTSELTNMKYMFIGIGASLSNDGPVVDLSYWDTSQVTDMSYMFYYSNVRAVKLDNVNIGKVSTMCSMFEGCRLLRSIDMHKCDKDGNETLDQLQDLRCMFKNDEALVSVDMSGLGLSSVTMTERMFQWVPKITSINFDGDSFESVENAYMMFQCPSMEKFDTSSWNMRSLTEAGDMFAQSSSLQYLNLTGLNMEHITSLRAICYGAPKLEYLNISNWNLSGITSVIQENIFKDIGKDAESLKIIADGIILPGTAPLFNQCGATSISMKNSDWSRVQSADKMFADCSKLKTLTITNQTNVDQMKTMNNMFINASALDHLNLAWIKGANLTSAEKAFSGATKLAANHKTDLMNVLKTTALTQEQIDAAFD